MKVRFDGLDVMAMVRHLNHVALGRRVINIYEGDSTDSYLFKLDHTGVQQQQQLQPDAAEEAQKEKLMLFLESGVRFHTTSAGTTTTTANNNPHKPLSPFVAQLRKHLRGLRLEQITQLGHGDRVVHFVFGMGEQRRALLLELYSKGNLVLCDNNYTIVALLRSHQYNNVTSNVASNHNASADNNNKNEGSKDDGGTVQVKVGHVYPVTYAARTMATEPSNDQDNNNTGDVVSVTMASSVSEWAFWAERQVGELRQLQQEQLQRQAKAADTEGSTQQQPAAHPTANKKGKPQPKKKKKGGNKGGEKHLILKTLLLKPTSGVSHYGPNFLEHCLLKANLQPHQTLMMQADTTSISGMPTMEQWEALIQILQQESAVFHEELHGTGPIAATGAGHAPPKGYILYSQRDKPVEESSKNEDNNETPMTPANDHADKILEEFQPYLLLQQHIGRPYLEFDTFNDAVDVFFGQLEAQKRLLKAQAAEVAARDRLAKIERDQQARVEQLEREVLQIQEQAKAVELNADKVEKARMVINSALDSGMDWEQLEQLVQVEQEENHNPIALLVYDLELDKDAMTLELPTLLASAATDDAEDSDSDEPNHHGNGDKKMKGGGPNGKQSKQKKVKKNHVLVSVALKETAHGNASDLFAKYRAMKEKVQRTIEASSKALKAAQETAQRQLVDAQKRTKQATNNALATTNMKPPWFTKFHWFITSDNYLVLGGRDAHQNEVLVKKYLRPGDGYLHADVHGAASCILRAKRIRVDAKAGARKGATKTQTVPLSDQALREAGNFTICRSSAWASKMVTSAWWVESHQVSKTAPTGEYLKVGAFMIRGKKNYLPPTPLEMGLGVVFRLAAPEGVLDPATMARHKNERRDFALMELLQQHEDDNESEDNEGASLVQTKKEDSERESDPSEPAASAAQDKADYVDEEPLAETDAAAGDVSDAAAPGPAVGASPSQDQTQMLSNEKVEATVPPANLNAPNDKGNKNKKKKGLSVKERKLIKRYGSLEEAERVLAEREQEQQKQQMEQELPVLDDDEEDDECDPSPNEGSMKRGKRGKKKKAMKKYADQDEEDRELAMLALQGGENYKKKSKDKRHVEPTTDEQKQAAAETAALLVKDAAKAAERLPEDVNKILAECVTVRSNNGKDGDGSVRWDKFDADVLEQLASLPGEHEAKLTAAKRLLFLKSTSRIDNFSASLSGILRTIQKYGYQNMETDLTTCSSEKAAEGAKRKTKQEKIAEDAEWKKTLKEEGVDEGGDDEDEDADLDDTAETNKLTGKPHPEDALLYALPVCAPYQTLSQYTYRIKLTPGNLKRGKAAKQCVEMFLKGDGKPTGSSGGDACRELLKKVADNDWVQVIATDVKIASAGSTKTTKTQKGKNKKPKNKK